MRPLGRRIRGVLQPDAPISRLALVAEAPLADRVVAHAIAPTNTEISELRNLRSSWSYGGRATRRPAIAGPPRPGARWPQAREQYRCCDDLGRNNAPHSEQASWVGGIAKLRPQCVSSVALQFGHTARRLCSR